MYLSDFLNKLCGRELRISIFSTVYILKFEIRENSYYLSAIY